jgi:hypothetical protein
VNHTTTTNIAHAAYAYINHHAWVLCAVNSDKKPAGSWSVGGTNRYDDTNSDQLFNLNTEAFGIIAGPSRLIIIDLDNEDAIRAWAARFGIPTTRIANTPRGKHLYYKDDGTLSLGPSTSLMPGVDVRAGESYAIIPPSTTSGGAYSWANENTIESLPSSVADLLREKNQPDRKHIPDGEPIPEGSRNDELWNRALRAYRAGLSTEAVQGAVRAEAEAHCAGSISENELHSIVKSAREYHERHDSDDESSIEDVIEHQTETADLAVLLDQLDITSMLETEPPPIEWVWEGYLARGTLNLLHGDAGLGKSLICLAIAAKCTIGDELLDKPTTLCDVAIIDAENSRDEIHRRIKTAYDRVSNPKRLHYYRTDASILGQRDKTAELFAWIKNQTSSDLIILDSQRALWEGDEREQGEAGRMLRYLARIAELLSVCILIIHHDTKAGEYSGSSDISAALTGSRLHLTRASKKDNADAEGWNERKLIHAKCRIGAEQPVDQFRIEMTQGISLERSGPTSDLDFTCRMIASYAREHEAWPNIPTADIHAEFEITDWRKRQHIYAHLEGMGVIESSPVKGAKHVVFSTQSEL